jgi:hypothetical protein
MMGDGLALIGHDSVPARDIAELAVEALENVR